MRRMRTRALDPLRVAGVCSHAALGKTGTGGPGAAPLRAAPLGSDCTLGYWPDGKVVELTGLDLPVA